MADVACAAAGAWLPAAPWVPACAIIVVILTDSKWQQQQVLLKWQAVVLHQVCML